MLGFENEHLFHLFIGTVIVLLMFTTIAVTGFAIYLHYKNVNKSIESVKTLIAYLSRWNDSISTRQGAFDFYLGLNNITHEIFKTSFNVLITKEEFEKLSLPTIKELNKQAIDLLESDLQRVVQS